MDHRLETLETKLAHLELALDELNQVVYEQSKQLEAAHRFIDNLQARMKEITSQGEDLVYTAEDERPPHY